MSNLTKPTQTTAPRILVSDNLSEQGLDVLRHHPGVELDYQPGLDEDALAKAIVGAAGLVIRSGSKVSAKVLAAADSLKAVGRAGIGVDNIDVKAASQRGVVVMNTPTGNSVTTAEHTIALMMALARHIPQATATLKAGVWAKKKLKGRELAGKTIGVIGLGTIGRIVADRAQGLKMNVIGSDPSIGAERAAELGIKLVSLDELLASADVISVHTPLTPKTKGLINEGNLKNLKKGVLLVNCARGGIYDEGALLVGLKSGHLGGVALDVFVQEPPPADHPLLSQDRLICSPHLGASTSAAQDRVAVEIAHQVIAYILDGEVKNGLNVPSLSKAVAAKLAPYLRLANHLGSLVGQTWSSNDAKSFSVSLRGAAAGDGDKALVSAALSGFLASQVGGPVNAVAAPHVAKERGLSLETSPGDGPQRESSSIHIAVTGKSGATSTALGTLAADGSPRLAQLDSVPIDAPLSGVMLVVKANAWSGVAAATIAAVEKTGANVAGMNRSIGVEGRALACWRIENGGSQDIVDNLSAHGSVAKAQLLCFGE